MTPLEDAYMLEESCKLSFAVVRDIFDHGFSRVPVYARERQHVVGLLFVKDLIFVDPEDEVPLAEYLRVFERSIELVDGNAQCRERPADRRRDRFVGRCPADLQGRAWASRVGAERRSD